MITQMEKANVDGISKEALALKKAFAKFKKELGGEVNDSPLGT